MCFFYLTFTTKAGKCDLPDELGKFSSDNVVLLCGSNHHTVLSALLTPPPPPP